MRHTAILWYVLGLLIQLAISALVGLVLTFVLILTAAGLTLTFGVAKGAMLALPAALLLALGFFLLGYLTIAVHETGHLLVARILGWRVVVFKVGPLKWLRDNGGWRLHWDGLVSHPFGLVGALPSQAEASVRTKVALFLGAGPLGNVLLAASCMALVILAYPTVPAPARIFVFLVPGVLAIANALVALSNLVPTQIQGQWTDGARLRDFLQGNRRGERWLAVMHLQAGFAQGLRPRNWDAGMVERMLMLRDDEADDLIANVYGFYYAIDSGQIDRAGECLDRALTQCAKQAEIRPFLWLEAAAFEALYRSAPEKARMWLTKAMRRKALPHTCWRAQAAVLLAEGQSAEALSMAMRGLAEVAKLAQGGGILAERDLLTDIVEKCRASAEEGTGPGVSVCS